MYPYHVVGIPEVKLGENRGSLKELESRCHERQGVSVPDGDFRSWKSMHGRSLPSFLPTKKNLAPADEEEGLDGLVFRC